MVKMKLNKETRKYLEENPNAIICFETCELFKNSRQAAKKTGLSYAAIHAYVRGTRSSSVEGYTFDYLNRLNGYR